MDRPRSAAERRYAVRTGRLIDAEQSLTDPCWTVREAAAERLQGSPRDTTAFETLFALTLADPVPHVRDASARAIADTATTADYREGIHHQFERQRIRAADALGRITEPQSIPALVALVADAHVKVRRAALLALARKPASQLVSLQELIARKLRENEPAVRRAAEALARHLSVEDSP